MLIKISDTELIHFNNVVTCKIYISKDITDCILYFNAQNNTASIASISCKNLEEAHLIFNAIIQSYSSEKKVLDIKKFLKDYYEDESRKDQF
jgi:hypothetical protein